MTTIPGHNIIIQQSGSASEMLNPANPSRLTAEQAAAQQEARDTLKNKVQEFDESERLKAKKEKEAEQQEQERQEKRKKQNRGNDKEQDKELDPDAPGRLVDTMV